MRLLTSREWLEQIYAAGGPTADLARDALDEMGAYADRQEMGDYAYEVLCIEAGLCVGDDPQPLFERIARQAGQLRKLCVEAGLIRAGDRDTDPLPLIRMFLPVD